MGPKKPDSHDSQDAPVKPDAQEQILEDVQTPLLEQAGSHEEDCMSTKEREPETASWDMSGIESQNTIREVAPTSTIAQTLEPRTRDWVVNGVEILPTGLVGRGENTEEPP